MNGDLLFLWIRDKKPLSCHTKNDNFFKQPWNFSEILMEIHFMLQLYNNLKAIMQYKYVDVVKHLRLSTNNHYIQEKGIFGNKEVHCSC